MKAPWDFVLDVLVILNIIFLWTINYGHVTNEILLTAQKRGEKLGAALARLP